MKMKKLVVGGLDLLPVYFEGLFSEITNLATCGHHRRSLDLPPSQLARCLLAEVCNSLDRNETVQG